MPRWSRSVTYLPRNSGFSLIELIITLTLLGILAAVAAPRFFQPAAFESRFFVDDLRLAMQYAQKRAVNGGCKTEIRLTVTGYSLWRDSTCDGLTTTYDQAISHPGEGGTFSANFPDALSLTSPALPLTIQFTTMSTITDASGVILTSPFSLTLQQAGNVRTISLHGSTGVIE